MHYMYEISQWWRCQCHGVSPIPPFWGDHVSSLRASQWLEGPTSLRKWMAEYPKKTLGSEAPRSHYTVTIYRIYSNITWSDNPQMPTNMFDPWPVYWTLAFRICVPRCVWKCRATRCNLGGRVGVSISILTVGLVWCSLCKVVQVANRSNIR